MKWGFKGEKFVVSIIKVCGFLSCQDSIKDYNKDYIQHQAVLKNIKFLKR